jgi:hypothetical protein
MARPNSLRLELRLQIPATALSWPGMRIEAGGFQVGRPHSGRYERDGNAVVDGVRRMGVKQSKD